MREGFILYKGYRDTVNKLSNEDAGILLKAIFEYQAMGNEIKMPYGVSIAFSLIKNQFEVDNAKYEEKLAKCRENGAKGGRPIKENRRPSDYLENQTVFLETGQNHKEKEKEKDKVKVKVKEKENNISSDFEKFYNIYPRKEAKNAAFKSWEKVLKDGVSSDDIFNGVKCYNNYITANKVERRYIKMPATWLNQGCWTDEYVFNENQSKDAILKAIMKD